LTVVATGGIAGAGFAPAAGGVDVAGALTSVVPGIRRLKKIIETEVIPANGGRVQIDLPKSSYLARATVRITGKLRVVNGGGGSAAVVTPGDLRSLVERFEFALSGSTNPRVLTGLQADIIENLDVPAISANKRVLPNAGAAYNVAAGATDEKAFEIQFTPLFTVSAQNLYGIPYLGAPGTVPQINLTLRRPEQSMVVLTNGTAPVATLVDAKVEVEGYRIDLPAPIMPQTITNMIDGRAVESQIPGQGLYHESSYILHSRMFDAEDVSGPGSTKRFRLPIGPDYLRIILLAYKNGVLDDESAPLLRSASLVVQQTTSIEDKAIWQFDREFQHVYNKARPSGVYVFSGIDETGTDADLYVSRDLGNFDLEVVVSDNAVPANSRFEVITQELLPLSTPGQYL
jgi:hypothetical protein